MDELYDHPRPIVCTCGHAFGHHEWKSSLLVWTRCACDCYITDWAVMTPLGFTSKPVERKPVKRRPSKRAPRGSARTRWMACRRTT